MSTHTVKMPSCKPLQTISAVCEMMGKLFISAVCILLFVGTGTDNHNWTAIIICTIAGIAFMCVDVLAEQYSRDVIMGR